MVKFIYMSPIYSLAVKSAGVSVSSIVHLIEVRCSCKVKDIRSLI